jgi:DNA-binding HxlR family transcriptional regulator
MSIHRVQHAHCSIARTLALLGDTWLPLILRDVLLGVRRFDEMERDLGIASNMLSNRLTLLRDRGLIRREPYQTRPTRYLYLPTEKGVELFDVLLTMMAFGDRHLCEDEGPPMVVRHLACGLITHPRTVCQHCGNVLTLHNTTALAGPGAKPTPGTRVLATTLPPWK